jgi:hypothetical protein
MSNLPIFPVSFRSIAIANVAATSTQNVVQGGANGTIIQALTITSNDTIDHALSFSINVAGVLAPIGNVNVSANSGNGVVSSVNLLANNYFSYLPLDPVGNRYIYLANSSVSLVVSANSVNSSGKIVSVSGQGGDY